MGFKNILSQTDPSELVYRHRAHFCSYIQRVCLSNYFNYKDKTKRFNFFLFHKNIFNNINVLVFIQTQRPSLVLKTSHSVSQGSKRRIKYKNTRFFNCSLCIEYFWHIFLVLRRKTSICFHFYFIFDNLCFMAV